MPRRMQRIYFSEVERRGAGGWEMAREGLKLLPACVHACPARARSGCRENRREWRGRFEPLARLYLGPAVFPTCNVRGAHKPQRHSKGRRVERAEIGNITTLSIPTPPGRIGWIWRVGCRALWQPPLHWPAQGKFRHRDSNPGRSGESRVS